MDLVPASSNSGLLLSTAAFSTCPVYLLLAAWAIGKAVISAQLLASTVWATSPVPLVWNDPQFSNALMPLRSPGFCGLCVQSVRSRTTTCLLAVRRPVGPHFGWTLILVIEKSNSALPSGLALHC
ncbi:hypothetical protein ATK30_6381 [Amycolatopsis echigonensis]|uniref:Uncharacterized protein n=1 Tax=Amycolatopsis echigonensis TaxID=2576905 RepID=A0A2N3WNL1_9PSEU|nr:hypothetical protein ATK30_6381 [Amycolatopsis niigatensis]